MKKLSQKTLTIAIVLIMLFSCSKEGPQGPAGSNGTDGNANVMYSNWITFVSNYVDVPNYKAMRIVEPKYTDGFIDSGGFYLGFIRWQYNVHNQLPYSQRFNSISSPIVEMGITGISFPTTGELRFHAARQDGGVIQSEFTGLITSRDIEIRYFLIKGNINLRLKNGVSVRDYYKSKSYEEICALTGAPL